MDFGEARRFMVDGQLRPSAVTDPLLLSAMRELPRESFLPASLRHRAYADELAPLPGGRAMLTPMVLARLIQATLPKPGERALVLGAGAGYGAAVLARMGLEVTAVEADPVLADLARSGAAFALHEHRPDVLTADPAQPVAGGAYSLILIEGAVRELPPAVLDQLAEGGRMAFLREIRAPLSRAVLARRLGGSVTETILFEAAAPVLPAFAGRRVFAL
jgi:protein-L-isoaspartate(D-aspartate) O-methyltransferase